MIKNDEDGEILFISPIALQIQHQLMNEETSAESMPSSIWTLFCSRISKITY
jgi:hypothetical protein